MLREGRSAIKVFRARAAVMVLGFLLIGKKIAADRLLVMFYFDYFA
jgi:hypothetical protein